MSKPLKITGIVTQASGLIISWSDGSVDTVFYKYTEDGLFVDGLSSERSILVKEYFNKKNDTQDLDPRLKDEVGAGTSSDVDNTSSVPGETVADALNNLYTTGPEYIDGGSF